MAAMTPEQIIKACRHCLGGACTACISTALDEARVAAVTAYASGHAHVCRNGKLKFLQAAGCSAGCGSNGRASLLELNLYAAARIDGWERARSQALAALWNVHAEARELVEAIGIPEEWSRLYETEGGEITG